MRYVKALQVAVRPERVPLAQEILARYGVTATVGDGWIEAPFEKSDSRLAEVQRALKEVLGHEGAVTHQAVFELGELEAAEFVRLRVYGFCGDAFVTWAPRLGLPSGTRVMDKRAMGKRDIARTYNWKEIVISERLREILAGEGLRGWKVEPVRHVNPAKDRFPPMYQLESSSLLPALAPETDIEVIAPRSEPPALVERGPLIYRRRDLTNALDVNWTSEVFLEPGVSHRYSIVSQRARRAFLAHKVRGRFAFEPVIITG